MTAVRRVTLSWLALLLLLSLTVGSSLIPLGAFNPLINIAIACGKSVIIALVFMRLWCEPAQTRLVSFAAAVWLLILYSLTLADYFTR